MSESARPFDAGHLSFLELIRVISEIAGAPFAGGALVKTGLGIAKRADIMEFADYEAFVRAVADGATSVARFEGAARYYENGVFGLAACPFAHSIQTYKDYVGGLPAEYAAVTQNLNRESATTSSLRVGHGAAVSPFCGVHQPLRSALAERIRVSGKPVIVHQLGCKSAAGNNGIAEALLPQVGVSVELVTRVLSENMCCYCARVSD